MPSTRPHSLFSEFDIDLFRSGKHYKLYEKFGAHFITSNGDFGAYFSVWVPSAYSVSVVGDFNEWDGEENPLYVRWDSSGIWEGFVLNVKKGQSYKFRIYSNNGSQITMKADPYAFYSELRPRTASRTWDLDYRWKDKKWMQHRKNKNALDKPFSVYEVHLGSWRRKNKGREFLSYIELADELVTYVLEMNFTHVEFMPVMEYPFDPSWGYQITGYYSPTSRFGTPQDMMFLIDKCHQAGIGVILDWVPSHFPEDEHGLANFDGTHLYDHPDRRKGYHPDWKSLIFNYERNEVRSFLISNALFWLDLYHVDALRVDAVASIIYLDYSREDGEWEPNVHGGKENIAAISFLKELNEAVYGHFEGVQTIAEESTSFEMVTSPTSMGGLGFGMKWMMGWMNDTLGYFSKEAVHRKYHQGDISFSLVYAFSENFMLPLSHDEVVHGKNSLLSNMPGGEWERFANLRLLYSYMFTHPGTKLLFMGSEIGQYDEWDSESSIQWHLLEYPLHYGLRRCVKQLNLLYKSEPALYEKQFSHDGFEWIIYDDHENSVLAYMRKGHNPKSDIIVVCNFTPVMRKNYRLGVNDLGNFVEIFNSDSADFGGSNLTNDSEQKSEKISWNGKMYSMNINLPPLATVVFKKQLKPKARTSRKNKKI